MGRRCFLCAPRMNMPLKWKLLPASPSFAFASTDGSGWLSSDLYFKSLIGSTGLNQSSLETAFTDNGDDMSDQWPSNPLYGEWIAMILIMLQHGACQWQLHQQCTE
jgi:hypothetical protein